MLAETEELAVGAEDGEGAGGFSLEEEEHGGGAVEDKTAQEEVAEGATGEVFVEHEEVIPVIEKELAGVVHGEGSAAEVVNHGRRTIAEMPARVAKTPAEVDFLHVGEKPLVEPAGSKVCLAADAEGGAAAPENVGGGVVLPAVGFHRVEYASATERIAEAVDEASGGTGVFELLRAEVGFDFGLDGGNSGLCVQGVEERRKPAGGDFDVAVEKYDNFFATGSNGTVVASGKSVIAVEVEPFHFGKLLPEHLHGAVGGSVVRHHDGRKFGRGVGDDGGKVFSKEAFPVPIEDNHGDFRHRRSVVLVYGDKNSEK